MIVQSIYSLFKIIINNKKKIIKKKFSPNSANEQI